MGILQKLQNGGTTLRPNVTDTTIQPGANSDSTLHLESSLNNTPNIPKPASNLDLNAQTPKKYLDNLPE